MKKVKFIIPIQVEVSFFEYDTGKKNEVAKKQVKRYIKDLLKNEISFIPLYIETHDSSFIEDCTQKTKVTFKDV